MTDKMTPNQRHYCMSQIHSSGTKPEMLVRRWLWSHGYRYRLNVKGVPGKPDIVMRKYRTAIFVNGCFWHGHEGCEMFRMPKSNIEFWENKIHRNQERDTKNYQILQENGWQVLVLWECKLTDKVFENTMNRVDVMLQEYYLATISPKVKNYIRIEEDDLPMVAEYEEDYSE